MRGVPFYRLSGNGNDFLALVEPASEPGAETVRAWCRRGLSLGADGLFVLEREGGGLRMRHWNADGGVAALCLNGTRCAARLARELGWCDDRLELRTDAGPIHAGFPGEDAVRLELPAPAEPSRTLEIELPDGPRTVHAVTVGVPHAVVESEQSLESLDLSRIGPALRRHDAFAPEGTNVDAVRFPRSDTLEIRTWERGVEGETLACGTGILAAAFVGLERGAAQLPLEVRTLGGFPTRVEGELDAEGRLQRWALVSDARLIARGEILPGAEACPPDVDWSR